MLVGFLLKKYSILSVVYLNEVPFTFSRKVTMMLDRYFLHLRNCPLPLYYQTLKGVFLDFVYSRGTLQANKDYSI